MILIISTVDLKKNIREDGGGIITETPPDIVAAQGSVEQFNSEVAQGIATHGDGKAVVHSANCWTRGYTRLLRATVGLGCQHRSPSRAVAVLDRATNGASFLLNCSGEAARRESTNQDRKPDM